MLFVKFFGITLRKEIVHRGGDGGEGMLKKRRANSLLLVRESNGQNDDSNGGNVPTFNGPLAPLSPRLAKVALNDLDDLGQSMPGGAGNKSSQFSAFQRNEDVTNSLLPNEPDIVSVSAGAEKFIHSLDSATEICEVVQLRIKPRNRRRHRIGGAPRQSKRGRFRGRVLPPIPAS